jgi:rhodanese-related sulfurtransferase
MMNKLGFMALVSLSLILTLAACAGTGTKTTPTRTRPGLQTQKVPVDGGSYTDVNVAGLAQMLERKDFTLINVHVPYDGELPSTDLFIPYDQIEANLSKLPADKAAKIVLYCRTGGMSAIAARTLVRLGYTDVWNLDGGMVAWHDAGY